MTALLNVPVTTAVTAQVGPTLQLRNKSGSEAGNMALQAFLAWGSGGTTVIAWVQTSFDGGTTWCDVARFDFVAAIKRSLMNVSSLTPKLAIVAATDGTYATPDTAVDGIFGEHWRVKYTTTGTYAGGTVLRVDAICAGLTAL